MELRHWTLSDKMELTSLCNAVDRRFLSDRLPYPYTEKDAKAAGYDCESVVLSPASHAGYYPGAKVMTMKVTFEKNTQKLLGAQIVGHEGTDKRIDVLATAICLGATADKLKDLDLAYAPPFSSAKDPVNMAGFMIDNIVSGRVKQFTWDTVEKLPRDGSVTLRLILIYLIIERKKKDSLSLILKRLLMKY